MPRKCFVQAHLQGSSTLIAFTENVKDVYVSDLEAMQARGMRLITVCFLFLFQLMRGADSASVGLGGFHPG